MHIKELKRRLKLVNQLIRNRKTVTIEDLKIFIGQYYKLELFPDEFYSNLKNYITSNNIKNIILIILNGNIYELIKNLKEIEPIDNIDEFINPQNFYKIPIRHINKIIGELRKLPENENKLLESTKEELLWLLKRNSSRTIGEYQEIAYKMYQTLGFENTIELLSGRYGNITYEQVYFMFKNLNTRDELNNTEQEAFISFLFNNKRDYNNIIRQMLEGRFNELFLNFDYFYNNISFFINKLGTKLSKSKVRELIGDRFVSHDISTPEITNDLLADMLSSYYCKYETLDVPKEEVYCRNYEVYKEFLKNKYQSSIPRIPNIINEDITAEVLRLNDPRNLVIGYRSGNCFRINGDANVLFSEFLKSEHMRIVSLSTAEYKDFAMMLVMRNGNVLIGQGIEISKRIPKNFSTKKIYDTCREVLKEIMNYINSNDDDEIVATIIGSSNSNVSNYNNNILPFLVSPILESSNVFYNGIYNYQCLLDILNSKTLYDIKLYTPHTRYLDERASTFVRDYTRINYDEYLEMEKILRALRFNRIQEQKNPEFYRDLIEKKPKYIACNREWYITLYEDGTIDSYILNHNDPRVEEEYNMEINKVYKKVNKQNKA